MNSPRNLALFAACLLIPAIIVVVGERRAAARIEETSGAAKDVVLASAAEDSYCSVQLKQVIRRVAGACGLLESGARGCKPADAKNVASLSGADFNALFKPLSQRAGIVQFDKDQVGLDDAGKALVEKAWSDQRGASFFFVVSRASSDGDAAYNQQLSQSRAQAVLSHLEQKFQDEDLKKEVGLLWLGEDYAQLSEDFCQWNRSRGEACNAKDINRSAFVAWIDCAI